MKNTDMPGNDYVAVTKFRLEGVHDWQSDEGLTESTAIATALDAIAQSNLAIAYEQRSANLIAMQALGITDMTDWLPEHSKWWIERAEEIETRLGDTK